MFMAYSCSRKYNNQIAIYQLFCEYISIYLKTHYLIEVFEKLQLCCKYSHSQYGNMIFVFLTSFSKLPRLKVDMISYMSMMVRMTQPL